MDPERVDVVVSFDNNQFFAVLCIKWINNSKDDNYDRKNSYSRFYQKHL